MTHHAKYTSIVTHQEIFTFIETHRSDTFLLVSSYYGQDSEDDAYPEAVGDLIRDIIIMYEYERKCLLRNRRLLPGSEGPVISNT